MGRVSTPGGSTILSSVRAGGGPEFTERTMSEAVAAANVPIRPETADDTGAIDLINMSAFAGDAEARLVDELRKTPAYVPELSLVAEDGGRVAGHLMLFRTTLAVGESEKTILTLAPTAVVPSRTHRGLGTALVREGVERARQMGFPAIVEVGFPAFYQRQGFRPITGFGLQHDLPVADDFATALELEEGALAGGGCLEFPAPFRAFYRRPVEA